MFVLESTYRKLKERFRELEHESNELLERWNKVARQINAKGGQRFLDHGSLTQNNPFSPEDLRWLISLCHPDKHDGKPMAVEMTQKLLALKEDPSCK